MTEQATDSARRDFERASEFDEARREYVRELAVEGPRELRGTLLSGGVAASSEEEPGESAEAVVVVQASSPEPEPDPGAALRHARIGVIGAVFLVMLLVWIKQKGNGNVG